MLNNDTEYTFNRPEVISSILDVYLVTEQVLEHVRDLRVLDWFDSDHKPIFLDVGRGLKVESHSTYREEFHVRACNLIGKSMDGVSEQMEAEAKQMDWDAIVSAEDLWSSIKLVMLRALKKKKLLRKPGK